MKTEQGWTIEGEESDVGYVEEFTHLLDHFDPGYFTAWWSTRAEYDQAHPVRAAGEDVPS